MRANTSFDAGMRRFLRARRALASCAPVKSDVDMAFSVKRQSCFLRSSLPARSSIAMKINITLRFLETDCSDAAMEPHATNSDACSLA